jgi:hypothetical protein
VKRALPLLFFAAVWALGPCLRAADFELGPQENLNSGHSSAPSHSGASSRAEGLPVGEVPVPIQAGDVPTAYHLRKYEVRTDFSFYEGGGILGKAYLGLFDMFSIGGAANVRGFIGSSDLKMTRDDAQLLAKLVPIEEDESIPEVAIGWDGPAYDRGEAKGLYLALSKQVPTTLGFIQLHGGLNTANVESFVGNRDLRASAALTGAIRNFGFFTAVDEVLHPVAPRWSLGLEGYFAPITLGLEWRDLASGRGDLNSTRMLRVGWVGRF